MIEWILATTLLTSVGDATAADKPKAKDKKAEIAKAMKAFSGAWEIIAVNPDGATKEARTLVFKKNGGYAALDKGGKELWAGTFEIDPTASPKVWDHRSHDAKKEGKDVLGIYVQDGDKLRVACVVGLWRGKEWVGKSRPTGFDPKQADVVIELKRVKSGP